jgi:hypothetical protein
MNIKNNIIILIIAIKIIRLSLYLTEIKGINIKVSSALTSANGGVCGYRYRGVNSVRPLKIYKAPKGYKDSFTSQKSHA